MLYFLNWQFMKNLKRKENSKRKFQKKNNINVKQNTTSIRYPIPLGNAKSDHSYFSGRGCIFFSRKY